MIRVVIIVGLACASSYAQVAVEPMSATAKSANSVVQWKQNVLPVSSASSAQAGTFHLMRSFAETQFRLDAPATLASTSYARGSNITESVGMGWGTTASVEAPTGELWGSAIQNDRNGITETTIMAHRLATAQVERLFTLRNATFGGGISALCGAKYQYDAWRQMPAPRAGDTENNRDTLPDLYWVPNRRPNDPSYPGAYALIGPFHFRSGLATLLKRIL
jgi:hypothetical protein